MVHDMPGQGSQPAAAATSSSGGTAAGAQAQHAARAAAHAQASASGASAPAAAAAAVQRMNGLQMVRLIVRQEGVLGLYRGFGASLATYVPSSALWCAAMLHVAAVPRRELCAAWCVALRAAAG
jgi:solute carrier family 25 protein 44